MGCRSAGELDGRALRDQKEAGPGRKAARDCKALVSAQAARAFFFWAHPTTTPPRISQLRGTTEQAAA